ncbi:LacI family DNA-binding transcriptional regulator [Microbacterium lacticum]
MNVHIEGEGRVTAGEERTRTASIRDVARAADVSYQTVSRVLNGHPSIRPATKQRVLDAMAELRYRPNQAARALVTSRSRTLGVVLGSRGEYGPTSSLAALEDAARERGYWVNSAYLSDTRPETIRAAVEHLRRQSVEGIIVHAPQVRVFDMLAELDVDVAYVGLHSAERGIAEIADDQVHGARMVTEHLISLGHVEILHVAGPQDWIEAESRMRGVLSPNDTLARAIITSVKQAGKDISTFTVTGQDSEVESVKSIMAGEQYSTINKDTSLLVEQTIKMIGQLQMGEEVDVNDTEQYDNGVKVVPAYLLPPVIVTKENAAEAYANNPTLLDIVEAAQ